jgi:UDP-2,3-diacylglucosamine pyrophosphatase LpxH
MDAIVISDLHLGSDTCQSSFVIDFLEGVNADPPKELVLNGDVFDSWDFRRLKKDHWKILSLLRTISDHCRVIWVEGNHDGPADVVSHLIGVEVVNQYIVHSGGSKILVIHGHVFDKFINEHPFITHIADSIYSVLQKMDKSYRLAKKVKRGSKMFLRCSSKIEVGATQMAENFGCDAVICGHTHNAYIRAGTPKYINCGCWTEKPCHYATIDDGEPKLVEYV